MASATGIPEHINGLNGASAGEDEPLLGRRGDASQMEDQPLYLNLWIGEFLDLAREKRSLRAARGTLSLTFDD
jgi:hypothetical protein